MVHEVQSGGVGLVVAMVPEVFLRSPLRGQRRPTLSHRRMHLAVHHRAPSQMWWQMILAVVWLGVVASADHGVTSGLRQAHHRTKTNLG